MLVTLKEILKDAEDKKYGVGLFNMLNLEMARGIIEAAEEERSPLILGVAEVHLPLIPFEYAANIMRHIAEKSTVPVCLHFDHGVNYGKIMDAMRNGFSSVMYDGSSLPYEENIANTKEISKVAHSLGISVEAELGHVGQGSCAEDFDCDDLYTKPEEINDFIERADVDALAVAIGTAHGKYIKKPVLDIDRLSKLYEVSSKPLVLHGGSGLTDKDFRDTIEHGIRKVNICTEMCVAAREAYIASANHEIMFNDAKEAVKNIVKQRMQLFGSSNRV
ncbi:MAG: class II fructose-bisphosphate aldolase [Clostridia bacterium]|nr:class II fructose-bisphosphate aldolase [Clostridia bacterium]